MNFLEHDLIIVIVGIAFFLFTGLFAVLGFFHAVKNQKKQAIISFSIGFACIGIFIISLFFLM